MARGARRLKYEVTESVWRLKLRKALGDDGVYQESVKALHSVDPGLLRDVYNRWAQCGEFPLEWREVFIPKPGKEDRQDLSSYWRICLFSAIGKGFEHLVKKRLEGAMEERRQLCQRQFGLRRPNTLVFG